MDLPMKRVYDRALKNTSFSFRELKYAVDKGFLPSEVVITHAVTLLSEKTSESDTLFQLAALYADESIQHYIDKLAKAEPSQQIEVIKEKWLYVVLDWLFAEKDHYPDPLGIVEEICRF